MKIIRLAFILVILSLCLSLTAAEQFGIFVVDSSQSMNQPEHNPRLERAIEMAIQDLHEFERASVVAKSEPWFKVVAYNDGHGYFEQIDWTDDPSVARAALEAMRDVRGSQSSSLQPTLRIVGDDLIGKDVKRSHKHAYLYTDDALSPQLTGHLLQKRNSGINLDNLAKTAIWNVRYFESHQPEIKSLDAHPHVQGLLTLTEEPLSFLMVKADPEPDENTQEKATIINRYLYFNDGKYTNKIYVNTSSTGSNFNSTVMYHGAKTNRKTSAVRSNGATHLFHKGLSNGHLWYTYRSDTSSTWSIGKVIVPHASGRGPAAVVVNNVVRVYFLSSGSGRLVHYIESHAHYGGGLTWKSTIYDTHRESNSHTSDIAVAYDAVNNQELLFLNVLNGGVGTLYKRALGGGASQWHHYKSFSSQVQHPSMVAANGDIYMTYRRADSAVMFMKRSSSTPWDATQIQTGLTMHETTDTPGLMHLNGNLVAVFKDRSNQDIHTVRSTNFGSSWAYDLGSEHTNNGIGAIAYSYELPLSCFISGDLSGSPYQTLYWTANVSGGCGPYTYRWYLNGALIGSSSTASQTFYTTGNHLLELVVTDSKGDTCIHSFFLDIDNCGNPFFLGLCKD